MKRDDEIEIIRASLAHYATRGAFRSFSEVPGRPGKLEFRFLWFRDVTFRVTYEAAARTLTFVDFLPAVPARSSMDTELRRFIRSRSASSLPDHRRVDLKKVGLAVTNRRGAISLVFSLKAAHIEYGVKKSVHLAYDVLMDFLNESQYVEYNINHFNLNPEMA